jgi:aryl carrier-like protein
LLRRHGFEFVVEQDPLLQNTDLYNIYAVHSSKVKQAVAQSNGKYETAPLYLSKSYISAEELQEFLEKKLPQYMVPPSYIILDELPVLPNGKLDRRALLSIEDTRPEVSIPVESRKTPTEEVLAQIWCGVLGVDSIGIQDNFFDLGGHSLLAMQVMSRVRRALRVELRVRTLFESPTLAALAECVARARTGAHPADATEQVAGAPGPPARHFPLSYAQLGIWQREQLDRRNAENHLSMVVRLRGRLQFAALEQALNEVVRRHSILRTAFAEVEGQPAQFLSESCELTLRVLDLSAEPEGERAEKVRQLARAHALEPFDLSRAPLLRVTVLQMAEHEHELLITTHQLVADSWSRFVLLRELVALYGAAASGNRASLADLPVQYAELAQRQREWLAGEVAAGQLTEWRERLQGAPALDLPMNRAQTPESSSS